MEKADGEIIVLTDIDCIYQKNWLRRINEIFQNEKYNVITSHALPYSNQKNSLAELKKMKTLLKIISKNYTAKYSKEKKN